MKLSKIAISVIFAVVGTAPLALYISYVEREDERMVLNVQYAVNNSLALQSFSVSHAGFYSIKLMGTTRINCNVPASVTTSNGCLGRWNITSNGMQISGGEIDATGKANDTVVLGNFYADTGRVMDVALQFCNVRDISGTAPVHVNIERSPDFWYRMTGYKVIVYCWLFLMLVCWGVWLISSYVFDSKTNENIKLDAQR